jgi:hypothetical protein
MYGHDSYVKRSFVDSRATALGLEHPYGGRGDYPRTASPRENIRQVNILEREYDVAEMKEADRLRISRERTFQEIHDRISYLEHENKRLVQEMNAWGDRVSQLAAYKNHELTINDQMHQSELDNYRSHNFAQIEAMAD